MPDTPRQRRRLTLAQRRIAHDVAVSPGGAALVIGRYGRPRGLRPEDETVTIPEAVDVARAGFVRIRRLTGGHYVAAITARGLEALATPDAEAE